MGWAMNLGTVHDVHKHSVIFSVLLFQSGLFWLLLPVLVVAARLPCVGNLHTGDGKFITVSIGDDLVDDAVMSVMFHEGRRL